MLHLTQHQSLCTVYIQHSEIIRNSLVLVSFKNDVLKFKCYLKKLILMFYMIAIHVEF